MYHIKFIKVIIEQWVPFLKIKTVHRKNVTPSTLQGNCQCFKKLFYSRKTNFISNSWYQLLCHTPEHIHYTFRFYLIILFELYSARCIEMNNLTFKCLNNVWPLRPRIVKKWALIQNPIFKGSSTKEKTKQCYLVILLKSSKRVMIEFWFISNTILNLKAPHVLLWLKLFSLISTLSFQFQENKLQFKINFVIKTFFNDFEICLVFWFN